MLLAGVLSTAALAQSTADTTSTPVIPSQEGTIGIGTRFPQSATDALVELDLSTDVVELDVDEDDGGGQNVSSLLGASRDPYLSQVQFNLSAYRFQVRGYESDYSSVYFNGFSFQDPEFGYANYNVWGGMNDVMRNYTTVNGLAPSESSYGNIGGVTTYNTRASNYRKQSSISYAASNRTYTHRIMATTATGLLNNGWAFVASVSTRLGKSGYMDATPYEGYSFFAAVEKQFNKKHSLNLTFMDAMLDRGVSSAVVQEVYDYRDYHYNPNWGYYDGEVRSSRIRSMNLPMTMLNYTWNINEQSKLEAGISVLFGRNGSSALDWYDGNDPRPDYYRKLPSYVGPTVDDDIRDMKRDAWSSNNTEVTQIDWEALYAGNYAVNANTPRSEGWEAITILKEYRNDQQTFSGFTNYTNHFNEHFTLVAGVEGKRYKGMFFQVVKDALGADYILNIDKFTLGDNVNNVTRARYDLNDPELKKYEGDKYGYDYEMIQNNLSAWAQAKFTFGKFDYVLAGNLGYTEFWRNGNMRNGRFLLNSYGEGKHIMSLLGSGKFSATYKISGRNFASMSAGYETRPPLFKNTYIQPRYNSYTVGDYGLGVENEKIATVDASYNYRGPVFRMRASAFYTLSKDASEVKVFYMESSSGIVQYITQGLDKQYMGLEFGGAYKITSTITAEGALSYGQYTYASNPSTATIDDDNADNPALAKYRTAYIKGYHIGGMPQAAGSLTLTYRSPKYWFVGLTGSCAGNSYIELSYDRRTTEAVGMKEPGTPSYEQLLDQEKFPVAYSLDAFGGASWRVKGGILGFNGNVQNLLNKNFKTGGFEQLRFDAGTIDKFPSKYYYSFGLTFFAQVYYRF